MKLPHWPSLRARIHHRWFWVWVLRRKVRHTYDKAATLAYWVGWHSALKQTATRRYLQELAEAKVRLEIELLTHYPTYHPQILRYCRALRRKAWLRGIQDALRGVPRQERMEAWRRLNVAELV